VRKGRRREGHAEEEGRKRKKRNRINSSHYLVRRDVRGNKQMLRGRGGGQRSSQYLQPVGECIKGGGKGCSGEKEGKKNQGPPFSLLGWGEKRRKKRLVASFYGIGEEGREGGIR